jgi:hypothetical protein
MSTLQDWDHKAVEKAFAFVEQSIKAALASLEAVADDTAHERWCDDAIASKKLLLMALDAVNGDYFGDPDAASNEAAMEEADASFPEGEGVDIVKFPETYSDDEIAEFNAMMTEGHAVQ